MGLRATSSSSTRARRYVHGGATTARPRSTGTPSGSRASTSRTPATTRTGAAPSSSAEPATIFSVRVAARRTDQVPGPRSSTGPRASASSLRNHRDLVNVKGTTARWSPSLSLDSPHVTTLDKAGIEGLIPHRDPFLLIDRVTALE